MVWLKKLLLRISYSVVEMSCEIPHLVQNDRIKFCHLHLNEALAKYAEYEWLINKVINKFHNVLKILTKNNH